MRRRQRRLRSWLRHERMTVAMTLAEMTHHTAPRGPKMARVGEGVEHEQHDGLRAQKPPLPGERPGCLVDPGPQRSDRTVRRSAGDSLPTPGLPVLAGASGEAVDAFTLSFLTAKALEDTRKEEVARKEAQKEAKRRKKQDAVDAAMVEFCTLLLLLPKERETPETQRRLDELHQLLYPPSSSSGARRKKKKRRKKKTPKSSSFRSSSGVQPRRCGQGPAFARRRLVAVDVSVNMYNKFQQSPIYSGRCLLPFLRQSGGHSNYATETGTVVYRCSSRTRLFPCPVMCYAGSLGPQSARTCGVPTGAVLGQGCLLPGIVPHRPLCGSTGAVRGDDGRLHPSRGAKADPHGPGCFSRPRRFFRCSTLMK